MLAARTPGAPPPLGAPAPAEAPPGAPPCAAAGEADAGEPPGEKPRPADEAGDDEDAGEDVIGRIIDPNTDEPPLPPDDAGEPPDDGEDIGGDDCAGIPGLSGCGVVAASFTLSGFHAASCACFDSGDFSGRSAFLSGTGDSVPPASFTVL